ncbi:MAG: GDP-mannose 4,6-dehydratase [Lentisphaeria bacterium]|nr:GDP-mannose 4,6-dehydratase [Lentisphaeria bacterium]
MKKRFLITGGAGFIGSFLTESLLADGHFVTIIDNFSTGNMANLANVDGSKSLRIIEDDILTAPNLKSLVAANDCVIHLAAAVGVEKVVKDPVQTIITNVHGTERILTAAAEYSRRCIIASTSEVYGKSDAPFFKESDDLRIGSSTNSRWSYACSKLLDEFFLMAYYRNHALPGTVVRFFNTVGPRQSGRYGMVLPRFAAAAIKGEDLSVYGTGAQTRCFCHVKDVVRALRLLIGNENTYGKIYNIGTTRRISIEELAKMVIERASSASGIKKIPYEQAYEPGFEDMLNRAPDCSAIRELTSWEPQISLEEIIDDVVAYTREKMKQS